MMLKLWHAAEWHVELQIHHCSATVRAWEHECRRGFRCLMTGISVLTGARLQGVGVPVRGVAVICARDLQQL